MATLIGLFTEPSPSQINSELKAHFQFWNALLEPFNNPGECEAAIFLPGILGSSEEFKADFRRFSLVGQHLEDQIRNVFELGFEKGFDQVLFVNENWSRASYSLIKKAIKALNQSNMIFIPDEDGGLSVWGMNQAQFWKWPRFDCFRKEIVVEMIGLCLENSLPYSLLDS